MDNNDPKDSHAPDPKLIKRQRLRGIRIDRPIEQNTGDFLWQDNRIQYDFYRVAQLLVAPLFAQEAQSNSTTFAIYGKWGMGKSSALRLIEQTAHQVAGELAQQMGQQFDPRRLMFCHYPAPAYHSAQHSVRATLMFRILAELTYNDPGALQRILDSMLLVGMRPEELGAGRPVETTDSSAASVEVHRVMENIALLERLATKLSDLLDFDKRLDKYLNGSAIDMPGGVEGAAPAPQTTDDAAAAQSELHNGKAVAQPVATRVMVVLLDDLDRCRTEFVQHVLDTIHSWSEVHNLFFVLAVRQENLREAVERQLVDTGNLDDPNYALEKYVQYAINVPEMDNPRLQQFLSSLFKNNAADMAGLYDPETRRILTQVLADASLDLVEQTILAGAQLLEYALPVLTPRSVKRCLNEIESVLDYALEELPNQTDELARLRVLKKILLAYSWPELHTRWFAQERAPRGNLVRSFLTDLEEVFAQRAPLKGGNPDSERMRFEWQRIANRYDEPAEYNERLARFLSTPPYWFVDATASGRGYGEPQWESGGNSGEPPSGSDGASGEPPMAPSEDAGLVLNRLYVLSEGAEARQDRQAALAYADQLYQLVKTHREAFGKRDCATVGNVAITAERFGARDLATRLYQLAVELDPNHPNNIQNFVDFIVKQEVQDLYEDARRYIEQLKQGAAAAHKPGRTFTLEAQLNELMGATSQPMITQQQVQLVLEDFRRDPRNQQKFVTAASLLDQLKRYDDLETIARIYYEAATDGAGRYLALRAFADVLADSRLERNEALAMDLYAYLMRLPLSMRGETRRARSDLLHNFATLLYTHDFNPEAGRLWYSAYQDRMSDPSIQRSYSQYLLRAQKQEAAALVVEGRPLTGPVEDLLQPQIKELPPRFLTENIERWWELPDSGLPAPANGRN